MLLLPLGKGKRKQVACAFGPSLPWNDIETLNDSRAGRSDLDSDRPAHAKLEKAVE